MKLMRQLLVLWGLALIPAIVTGFQTLQWEENSNRVDLDTIRSWQEPVLWVDARSREDFEASHWPEAVLLNLEEWDALVPGFLEVWDPEQKVVVYCDGGACRASEEVAERIRTDFGHDQVFVLEGGWDALKDVSP